VVAAGVAVRAQDGVATVGRQPAIGFVGDGSLGHDRAVGEREIAQDEESILLDGADIGGAQRQGRSSCSSAQGCRLSHRQCRWVEDLTSDTTLDRSAVLTEASRAAVSGTSAGPPPAARPFSWLCPEAGSPCKIPVAHVGGPAPWKTGVVS